MVRIKVATTNKAVKEHSAVIAAVRPLKASPRAGGRALKILSESKCISHAQRFPICLPYYIQLLDAHNLNKHVHRQRRHCVTGTSIRAYENDALHLAL